MKKRIFYLASIVLLAIAVGFHCIGRERMLEGQRLKAKNIELAVKQQAQVEADPTAEQLSKSGRVLNHVGLVFTLSGLTCLVVTGIRREQGWYAIPILLLVFDLIVQLLL
jgi:hypothetical protein